MAKEINTIIILRNDATTAWETSSYKLRTGELGVGYLTRDDGTTAIIVKAGNGNDAWVDLPQVEGVFEKDLTLTYNFGRHKTSNGFVDVPAKGMTTSEWLLDALSEVLEPTITQPKIELGASIVGGGEMGSYITGVKWDGKYTDGSYEYKSVENNTSTATGVTKNDVSWVISNDIDTQTGSTEDGTFTFASDKYLQVDSESSKVYANVTGKYTLDAKNARTPLNNVGKATEGKIASITEQKTLSAGASATGYRKPFWGVKTTSIDVSNITSAQVRALGNSGGSTGALPSGAAALTVPEGSTQVILCAKHGAKGTLTATDDKAMNATVTFTKVENAVKVEGANGFTAVDYDMWYVQWGDPIGSTKVLTLKWS